jgi:hypothetical protein
MRNPVDRTAYRAPLHYARATSVDKRLALFHTRRVAESRLANHLGLVPAMPEAGWQRLRARSPRQPHHLRLGRLSAVDGAAVAACAAGIFVPAWAPKRRLETTGQMQTSRHRWPRARAMI